MLKRHVRQWTGQLGLILFGIVLALFILESATRLVLWIKEQRQQSAAESARGSGGGLAGLFEVDPVLEWKHVPFAEATLGYKDVVAPIKINSLGMNDKEYSVEKPIGTFRILMLGDSFTEAFQVPVDDSTQYRLEESLSAKVSELGYSHIEVLNAGVSGYGPGKEMLYYENVGRNYDPDLVIVMFFIGNDFEDESPIIGQRAFGAGILRKKYFTLENGEPVLREEKAGEAIAATESRDTLGADPNVSLVTQVDVALSTYSRFYPIIRPLILETPAIRAPLVWLGVIKQPVPTTPKYDPKQTFPALEEATRVAQALLSRLNKDVTANGGKMVVVIVPERNQVHQEVLTERFSAFGDITQYYDFGKPNRALTTYFDSHEIQYLDLLPIMRQHVVDTGEVLYYLEEGHWNIAGHHLAAEQIKQWLLANDLIPKP